LKSSDIIFSSGSVVFGWQTTPLEVETHAEPTVCTPATLPLPTSTPKTSPRTLTALLEAPGCTRAARSVTSMLFPEALSFSSIIPTLRSLGNLASSDFSAKLVTTAPFEFIATSEPTTVEPAIVVARTSTPSVRAISFLTFCGVSAGTIANLSLAQQYTPTYGLPSTSPSRSIQPLLRENYSSGRETSIRPSSNLIALTRTLLGGFSMPLDHISSLTL